MNYTDDTLTPDYSVGFGVSFGGGQPVAAQVSGQVASPGACTTCGANRFLGSLSLPLILVGIAVLVLAFRK